MDLVRFCWWNTGVLPSAAAAKADADHRKLAQAVVAKLIATEAIDVFALGEVRNEKLVEWLPASERAQWTIVQPDEGMHDVALMVQKDRCVVGASAWLSGYHAGSAVRPGATIEISTLVSPPVTFVVGHWRSDIGNAMDGKAKRGVAAESIKLALRPQESQPVLVVGDLNIEPFDDALVSSLPTSRSRRAVCNHKPKSDTDVLLYNASWRFLGERNPWSPAVRPPTLAGTYRHKSGRIFDWRTYDHVLASGALLGDAGWVLREDLLRLWTDAAVFNASRSELVEPFDHLPIIGALEWISTSSSATTIQP